MCDGRIVKRDGIDVTFDVVHTDQRFVQRKGHRLRIRNANEQRTNKPRSNRDRDTIDQLSANFGLGKSLFNNGNDLVEMLARGELGHDAAKAFVSFNLRRDD